MNEYELTLFKDKQLGFFIYLGIEAIMFTVLFATYLIFTPSSVGPHPSEVFDVTTVILTSVFLLSSSGTLWIAGRELTKKSINKIYLWLGVTLLLALIFIGLEINEFYQYVQAGNTLSTNSFLSSFYVLLGLHGAHVIFGCGWMIMLLIHLKRRISNSLFTEKFKIFSYYWHFVDSIWILIVLIVYLRYLF